MLAQMARTEDLEINDNDYEANLNAEKASPGFLSPEILCC